MKTKYVQKLIGANNSLEFTCEPCEGEYLDTKVQLNGVFLCWISFPDLEEFVNKLNNTIAEFAI